MYFNWLKRQTFSRRGQSGLLQTGGRSHFGTRLRHGLEKPANSGACRDLDNLSHAMGRVG
jgi:hypothetical protein